MRASRSVEGSRSLRRRDEPRVRPDRISAVSARSAAVLPAATPNLESRFDQAIRDRAPAGRRITFVLCLGAAPGMDQHRSPKPPRDRSLCEAFGRALSLRCDGGGEQWTTRNRLGGGTGERAQQRCIAFETRDVGAWQVGVVSREESGSASDAGAIAVAKGHPRARRAGHSSRSHGSRAARARSAGRAADAGTRPGFARQPVAASHRRDELAPRKDEQLVDTARRRDRRRRRGLDQPGQMARGMERAQRGDRRKRSQHVAQRAQSDRC